MPKKSRYFKSGLFFFYLVVLTVSSCVEKDHATSESTELDISTNGVDLSNAPPRGKTLEECNSSNGTMYTESVPSNQQRKAERYYAFGKSEDSFFTTKATTTQTKDLFSLSATNPPSYLPFENGTAAYVSQGFGGAYSHNTTGGYYSLDFPVDECTPILAVGEGRVMEIKEDSNIGGTDPMYGNCANYVIIDHGEQAYGVYVHMCKNCVLVNVGDTVARGQTIALAGNTGMSTTPHLHLQINDFASGNSSNKSYIHQGGESILTQGSTYTSVTTEGTIPSSFVSSYIPAERFSGNKIATMSTIAWYQGISKHSPITITGTVSEETTATTYVYAGLLNSSGNALYYTYVARSGADYSIVFDPSANTNIAVGGSYYFAISTSSSALSWYTSTGVQVVIGE
ncbi:MAG: M23 family metallopeptidase [Oligoflexia bacterium]|nr:M23 family metallopeptidase [Oligoflexia bacterium]